MGLEVALDRVGIVPGAMVSVASAGDTGNLHPHLHSLVSDGAWDRKTGQFFPWPAWLTGERLTELFRRQVLAMLVREERLAEETQQRLLAWHPSGFSVFVGTPIGAHETGVSAAAGSLHGEATGLPGAADLRCGDVSGDHHVHPTGRGANPLGS